MGFNDVPDIIHSLSQLVNLIAKILCELRDSRLNAPENSFCKEITEPTLLLLQFILAVIDFLLSVDKLASGILKSGIRFLKDPVVDLVNLAPVQLNLDRLLHKSDFRDRCNTLFPFKIRDQLIIDIVRQLIDIRAVLLYANIHCRHHIH